MTMIDQDTARLLVSEALKDRLAIKESGEVTLEQGSPLSLELILSADDQDKFSFSGPLIDLEIESQVEKFLQFKSSVQDAHELLNLLNGHTCKCFEYSIVHLGKAVKFTGPYDATIRKITNFDYSKNQCTVSIELIKTDQ